MVIDLPHERIRKLVAIDEEHKTVPQLFASALEEMGELARELKIEEKVFGNFHKKPGKDGSKGEAVDLFICANIVLIAHNRTPENNLWTWPPEWSGKPSVFELLVQAAMHITHGWLLGRIAIDIFAQRGGSQEEFVETLNKKLDKWESTQKGE